MRTAGAAAVFCHGENRIGTASLIAGSKHHQTSRKALQAECGLHFQPRIHSIYSHSFLNLRITDGVDRPCLLQVRIPDYYFIREGLTERQTEFYFVVLCLLPKTITDIFQNLNLKKKLLLIHHSMQFKMKQLCPI